MKTGTIVGIGTLGVLAVGVVWWFTTKNKTVVKVATPAAPASASLTSSLIGSLQTQGAQLTSQLISSGTNALVGGLNSSDNGSVDLSGDTGDSADFSDDTGD
jgi:hypothetical protein